MDIRDRITGRLRKLVRDSVPTGDKRATSIAVASSKGGVGKTTTAVNLAVAFAQKGYKTLLLDLDPQAHVASALRTDSVEQVAPISEVLLGRKAEVVEVARRSSITNLDLAGSDKGLAETEMVLSAKIGKELLLAGALEITRSHYDIVVIDCPPNLGTLSLNALCASDYLLVPCDMSVLALEGVSDIFHAVDTVQNRLGRSLEICGVLPTRVDARAKRINADISQSAQDLYGEYLLSTQIPQNSALNKAHLAGKSVFEFDGRSTGAQAYVALAEELEDRLSLCHKNEIVEVVRARA